MTFGPGPASELVVAPATSAELVEALAIRWDVFVVEQHVPADLEADEYDAHAVHVLARLDGVAVGTGRLLREEPAFAGLPAELGPVGHLGRIAVRSAARRHGVGAALVQALHQQAQALDLAVAYLGAQEHAVGFYRRLGYQEYGEPFDDAGIVHRHMWRQLAIDREAVG